MDYYVDIRLLIQIICLLPPRFHWLFYFSHTFRHQAKVTFTRVCRHQNQPAVLMERPTSGRLHTSTNCLYTRPHKLISSANISRFIIANLKNSFYLKIMQLWFCVSTIIESKRFKKALVGKNKQTITTNSVNSLVHWQLTSILQIMTINSLSIANKKIHKRRVK